VPSSLRPTAIVLDAINRPDDIYSPAEATKGLRQLEADVPPSGSKKLAIYSFRFGRHGD
jgi:hypothetical protein